MLSLRQHGEFLDDIQVGHDLEGNAPELQTVVKEAPLSALLVETDAPFLAPQPRRGKRNEPAFVRYVAEKIAAIRGLPVQAIAQITTANANRLFNWEKLVD